MILTVILCNFMAAVTTVWNVLMEKLSITTKMDVMPAASFLTVPCANKVITIIVGLVIKDFS